MRKRIRHLFIISAVLICAFILQGCARSSLYVVPGSSYVNIDSVDDIAFGLPKFIMDNVTTISEMSTTADYDPEITYLYKDGSTKLIAFNMDSLIVLAAKGTDFNLCNAEDKESALENGNLLGVYFHKVGKKKLKYQIERGEGVTKLVCDAVAEVIITDNLYNDFIGKLAVITNGEIEWSVFVGVPGYTRVKDIPKEAAEVTQTAALSLRPYVRIDESVEEVYEVVAGSAFDPPADEEPVEPSVSGNEGDAPEEPVDPPVINPYKEEVADSSVESPLSLGTFGVVNMVAESGQGVDEAAIRIDRIIEGAEATDIVRNHVIESGIASDLPAGTNWRVCEYTIDYGPTAGQPFINIRVAGLDGNALIHAGVTYSQRTHELYKEEVEEDIVKGACYYSIPYNCDSYLLICGEGSFSNSLKAAHILITDQEEATE